MCQKNLQEALKRENIAEQQSTIIIAPILQRITGIYRTQHYKKK